MRRAPSRTPRNIEMDRLLEHIRRLEAHNAELEDRLDYISQPPMQYLDRQPSYFDRGFDRTLWSKRNGPSVHIPGPYSSGMPGYTPRQNLRERPPNPSTIKEAPSRPRFRPGVYEQGDFENEQGDMEDEQGDSDEVEEGATEDPLPAIADRRTMANKKEQLGEDKKNGTSGDEKNGTQNGTRIKTVVNKWIGSQSKWEDKDSELDSSTTDAKIPALFRRQLHDDDKVDFEEVEIHSREMKDILLQTTMGWEDTITDSDQVVTVESPFYIFVENWNKHVQACEPRDGDTEPEKQAKVDLKDLMGFIMKSESLKAYFRNRDTIVSKQRVKFQFLWTLFGHQTLVYAKSYLNQMQMFKVRTSSNPGYKDSFEIELTAFDWDGTKFAPYIYIFTIKEYQNEVPIDSLDVVPIQYYKEKQSLQQQLIERGRKYVELCTQEPANFQCQYEGTALVAPTVQHRLTMKGRSENVLAGKPKSNFNALEVNVTSVEMSKSQSQVIIDNYSFLQSEQNPMKHNNMPPLGKRIPTMRPGCLCPRCRGSVVREWKQDPMIDPAEAGKRFAEDEDRLQLLPPRILGFALKEKVWGQFLVENVTKCVPKDDENREGPFWKDLELDKESKELLWAFMQQHKVTATLSNFERSIGSNAEVPEVSPKSIDIIEGKGQGLVILLHGPPGVGKTLTAETIALTTGRPLMTVSVAEIGVTAQEAEKSLTPVFADAARWEAVLLMDEADVFVEERTKGDLQRNALVSVLLRSLEYYKGIIILTTNRARTIDAALQSRIQLAIRYKDLTTAQKTRIYQNKLEYIPDEEFENKEELLSQLKLSPLVAKANKANGRQIRNIITYARALAKSEGAKLTLLHLTRVDQVTSEFTESMKDVFTRQRARNEVDYED